MMMSPAPRRLYEEEPVLNSDGSQQIGETVVDRPARRVDTCIRLAIARPVAATKGGYREVVRI
jgi:hypothetical protein